jgi:caa(3)-type oxidase subunit IV
MSEAAHHHPNYVKIWAILVVLLVVTVVGPMFEIRALTLLTAFGVAIVKAYLVLKNFMHVNHAARYVSYLLATAIVFMVLFFAGAGPDVMQSAGHNWEKPSWEAASAAAAAGGGHEGDHH